MENKEIEELLNNLNKKLENYELDKKFGQLSVDSIYHLFPNENQLLLSYIEQLENNRDKAIEYFKFENPEIFKNPKYTNHLWTIDGLIIKRFIGILKGDSDE